MDRMARGNVLATIKELKKTKRPHARSYTSAPAVQAIIGSREKVSSAIQAKLSVALQNSTSSGADVTPVYAAPEVNPEQELRREYVAFVEDYRKKKRINPSSVEK